MSLRIPSVPSPDRARSLFLVHGSAVAGKSWNALVAPLRDRVVVLAPDRLGQAPGERWPADRPTSFDAEAEHLAAALAPRPGRCTCSAIPTAARSRCRWRCAGPSGWRG